MLRPFGADVATPIRTEHLCGEQLYSIINQSLEKPMPFESLMTTSLSLLVLVLAALSACALPWSEMAVRESAASWTVLARWVQARWTMVDPLKPQLRQVSSESLVPPPLPWRTVRPQRSITRGHVAAAPTFDLSSVG